MGVADRYGATRRVSGALRRITLRAAERPLPLFFDKNVNNKRPIFSRSTGTYSKKSALNASRSASPLVALP